MAREDKLRLTNTTARSFPVTNALSTGTHLRQAKLLVSRRHAFFTKICVSPAGRVCVYSSLILSTFFFLLFFSSSIAVFFIAKPSSIVVFVVQTKWTFNHEGRGHRSLIGVSRGIGRPHRDTLGFSEYKNTVRTMLRSICAISNCLLSTTSSRTGSKHKLTDG